VASSAWYQEALGLRSGHGGEEFEMLFAGEEFVLQLHRADAEEHGIAPPAFDGHNGQGVSLWFEAHDDAQFNGLVERARRAGCTIASEPQWSPKAHHYEAMLDDPDGYRVVVHGPFQPSA
jgi:catechol 2,3-dioxygenase-like lactoylglutathione lyase family enzyme